MQRRGSLSSTAETGQASSRKTADMDARRPKREKEKYSAAKNDNDKNGLLFVCSLLCRPEESSTESALDKCPDATSLERGAEDEAELSRVTEWPLTDLPSHADHLREAEMNACLPFG